MAMDVDPAGHDDAAGNVDDLRDFCSWSRIGGNAAIADVNVAGGIVAAVGGIEDAAAGELHISHAVVRSFTSAPRMRPNTSAALGRLRWSSPCKGSATTLSIRKIWPAWSMPGVPMGICTAGVRSNLVPGGASATTFAGRPLGTWSRNAEIQTTASVSVATRRRRAEFSKGSCTGMAPPKLVRSGRPYCQVQV